MSTEIPTTDMIVMMLMIELESLSGPLFDEYFNGENQVVSKPFVVTTANASDKHQQKPDSTSSTSTLATSVTTDGNFDLSDSVDLVKWELVDIVKSRVGYSGSGVGRRGASLRDGDGGGGRVWRGKWGSLVAESGEGGGWEEEVGGVMVVEEIE
ncbi:hypothetical protein Tco_1485676 [Tanacetum coccineum]